MMHARKLEARTLRAEDGTTAELGEDDVLRIRNAEGALVFEHRPAEGHSVLYAAAGDLKLRAPHGAIDLDAEEVRVRGRKQVTMESEEGVHFFVGDAARGATSFFNLVRKGAAFVAPRLEARFEKAKVHAEEGEVHCGELATHAKRLRTKVEILETAAGRILEKARESYRETEGLSQTKAGRLRLVAEQTLHALGDRTLLKAHRDMKLRGEKIYIA
jgi:hypothetical protein